MLHRRAFIVVALLAGAVSAAAAQGVATQGVAARGTAPGRAWPTTRPADVGINASVLDSIDAEIKAGRYGYVDRMLVIRHGRVAYDATYRYDYDKIYGDSAKVTNALNPHDPTGPYNYFSAWWHPWYQNRQGDLHSLQSVTKTVTSVVIGVAVTRGEFPGIDAPILQFFDTTRVANIDDRKRRITIRHLLTMTGGFDWNENLPYIDPANTGTAMEASYDWVKYMIDRPMAREPGALFNYSSGETELLAHIFRRATGVDVEEYAARHLFAPLGIERWFWKRTPAGLADTEGGLYLEAGDLARIWYLFSQDGLWNGRRVVSSDWVRRSVAPSVSVGTAAGAPKYGFKWWLYPDPLDASKVVWNGSGFGGQLPMYFPDLDLVAVFYGWNILPGRPSLPLRRVMERLAKSVTAK